MLVSSHFLSLNGQRCPQSLNYSVLWGLSLGLSRQLLEKQLNLSIGAAVASAVVGTRKATRAQPSPLGEAETAGGPGEAAHVVGWAYDHAGL